MNGTIAIRTCREDDLRALEWGGLFTHHREILERTYREQLAGEQLMLIGEMNGVPVAQVWIDLRSGRERGTAILWAVRVHPDLQGRGLGARVVRAGEERIRALGLHAAELVVEHENAAARRFYERLGYRVTRPVRHTYGYTTPAGEFHAHHLDLFEMRKELRT